MMKTENVVLSHPEFSGDLSFNKKGNPLCQFSSQAGAAQPRTLSLPRQYWVPWWHWCMSFRAPVILMPNATEALDALQEQSATEVVSENDKAMTAMVIRVIKEAANKGVGDE